jgi:PHD/YefM family antitoxin component YafN of YafNO toxin-antitoxin module
LLKYKILDIMLTLQPQYITDTAGKQLVVLSLEEYNQILEELEEIEDLMDLEDHKAEDDGYRMDFDEYVARRKSSL